MVMIVIRVTDIRVLVPTSTILARAFRFVDHIICIKSIDVSLQTFLAVTVNKSERAKEPESHRDRL